eukprot:Platyproteum_vivax@DN2044_c0_g1_i2.p1
MKKSRIVLLKAQKKAAARRRRRAAMAGKIPEQQVLAPQPLKSFSFFAGIIEAVGACIASFRGMVGKFISKIVSLLSISFLRRSPPKGEKKEESKKTIRSRKRPNIRRLRRSSRSDIKSVVIAGRQQQPAAAANTAAAARLIPLLCLSRMWAKSSDPDTPLPS